MHEEIEKKSLAQMEVSYSQYQIEIKIPVYERTSIDSTTTRGTDGQHKPQSIISLILLVFSTRQISRGYFNPFLFVLMFVFTQNMQ